MPAKGRDGGKGEWKRKIRAMQVRTTPLNLCNLLYSGPRSLAGWPSLRRYVFGALDPPYDLVRYRPKVSEPSMRIAARRLHRDRALYIQYIFVQLYWIFFYLYTP